jgi:probable rRNA maturation factor
MSVEIIVGNHQQAAPVGERWLLLLENAARTAADLALARAAEPDPPLAMLETVEVALVDDETSARVHQDFMGVEGATDVITFHHGELVISAPVAIRQAAEFGEPPLRELLRYIVHGLLHLAGHDDADPADRRRMEAAQEDIVAQLWTAEMARD